MTSRALPALAALLLLAPLTGCVSFEMNRLSRDLRHDVEAQTDAEVGDGFAVGFGRLTMGTTRFLGRLAAPSSTREARQIIGHVKAVKVGHYRLRGAFDGRAMSTPRALRRYREDGWSPFVVARDSAAAAWVFLRERPDGRLTDLLAVVMGEGNLVLTKVSGNLNGLVLDAVALGAAGGRGGLLDDALDRAGVGPRAARDSVSGAAPPAPQALPATAGGG
ncbi:hypothetical protein [Rubrivirga litoralis]|uniref:DUF4252 domain-containing protein n=1 Tax=Rubrivirga litoralis TaxID=3075598 RepID=A0ABU3BT28_9BACT|nr:hypothetical protein [Rubrivirga sp. F394]MDT0632440.1 hypothetical protein [Rubrivirga sp. F394]